MTVQELIDELNKIEDKSLEVDFMDYEHGEIEVTNVYIKYIRHYPHSKDIQLVCLSDQSE